MNEYPGYLGCAICELGLLIPAASGWRGCKKGGCEALFVKVIVEGLQNLLLQDRGDRDDGTVFKLQITTIMPVKLIDVIKVHYV